MLVQFSKIFKREREEEEEKEIFLKNEIRG